LLKSLGKLLEFHLTKLIVNYSQQLTILFISLQVLRFDLSTSTNSIKKSKQTSKRSENCCRQQQLKIKIIMLVTARAAATGTRMAAISMTNGSD